MQWVKQELALLPLLKTAQQKVWRKTFFLCKTKPGFYKKFFLMMNVFDKTVLTVLEQYLDDEDASSLARVCKAFMFVCYCRASRLFRWENKASSLTNPFLLFPSDPFLRMQCAKVHLATATWRTDYKSQPMSFDEYKQRVMFAKPSALVVSHGQRKTNFRVHERAMAICASTASAKCAMVVRQNNVEAYKRFRNVGVSFDFDFFVEAAYNCDSVNADVTLLLSMVNGNIFDRSELQHFLPSFLKWECEQKEHSFYLFEHPKLQPYFFDRPLFTYDDSLFAGDCFYTLLTQKRTLWNAYQFMHRMKLSYYEVRYYLKNSEKSFLYRYALAAADRGVESHLLDRNDTIEKEIKNCLLFEPTQSLARKRLRQWLAYYEKNRMLSEFERVKKFLE
ncbi:MAG: hypothetical protein K2Q45_05410 [Nitrosomonas sp.]|nr:hypothetical protein [Nitrosomonas sp.]